MQPVADGTPGNGSNAVFAVTGNLSLSHKCVVSPARANGRVSDQRLGEGAGDAISGCVMEISNLFDMMI